MRKRELINNNTCNYSDDNKENNNDPFIEILIGTLSSLHCYLLHINSQLYRNMNDNNKNTSRFTTKFTKKIDNKDNDKKLCFDLINEELKKENKYKSLLKFINKEQYDLESIIYDIKTDINKNESSNIKDYIDINLINYIINKFNHQKKKNKINNNINFGINILKWISFKEKPQYKNLYDEIINNTNSTINKKLYENFLIESMIKIKNNLKEYYHLNEMISIKLYTDTTKFAVELRRAFCASTSLQIKKQFYWWAITLYKTSLYHSRPIKIHSNLKTPPPLFHGMYTI